MTIGTKIADCRKRAGMSQEKLANELNISRQAVSRWETGEAVPDTEKVIQLSKIFCVTTDYLLLDTVESPQSAVPAENQNGEAEERIAVQRAKRQSLRIYFGKFLLIFGILSLAATLVGTGFYAQTLTEWWTELGRYGTALLDSWLLAPFIVSAVFTLCGIVVLVHEYIFIGKE